MDTESNGLLTPFDCWHINRPLSRPTGGHWLHWSPFETSLERRSSQAFSSIELLWSPQDSGSATGTLVSKLRSVGLTQVHAPTKGCGRREWDLRVRWITKEFSLFVVWCLILWEQKMVSVALYTEKKQVSMPCNWVRSDLYGNQTCQPVGRS